VRGTPYRTNVSSRFDNARGYTPISGPEGFASLPEGDPFVWMVSRLETPQDEVDIRMFLHIENYDIIQPAPHSVIQVSLSDAGWLQLKLAISSQIGGDISPLPPRLYDACESTADEGLKIAA
jgi:hypothetical protein